MGIRLEVFKMCCYLGFPLTAFLSYNRPDLFGQNRDEVRRVSICGRRGDLKKTISSLLLAKPSRSQFSKFTFPMIRASARECSTAETLTKCDMKSKWNFDRMFAIFKSDKWWNPRKRSRLKNEHIPRQDRCLHLVSSYHDLQRHPLVLCLKRHYVILTTEWSFWEQILAHIRLLWIPIFIEWIMISHEIIAFVLHFKSHLHTEVLKSHSMYLLWRDNAPIDKTTALSGSSRPGW